MVKVVPSPSVLLIRIDPPCRSTIWWTIAKPSPSPPYVLVLLFSAWLNGSKIMRQELRRNAFARILDNNLNVGENVMRLYLYLPATRGERDSIGEQVPHDLLQTPWIARHQALGE
jgi:hypothetical protein